ncbi:MAG: exosortase family protein XrtF [Flavobacteriales bacterium]|nr:exosortase family protein XrtF [Flavobacteriales bacterium]
MKVDFSNPLVKFVLKAVILFIGWYLVYELWLHPKTQIDLLIINNLIFFASAILKGMGYELINLDHVDPTIRTIGIDGTHGLWVGDPCNGLSLIALYAGFIISFPGNWKVKLAFIPSGILLIHILNIFRIVGLCLVTLYYPDWLDFNHTYTFKILIYAVIFLLWYIFATRFTPIREAKKGH